MSRKQYDDKAKEIIRTIISELAGKDGKYDLDKVRAAADTRLVADADQQRRVWIDSIIKSVDDADTALAEGGQLDLFTGKPAGSLPLGGGERVIHGLAGLPEWTQFLNNHNRNRRRIDATNDAVNDRFLKIIPYLSVANTTTEQAWEAYFRDHPEDRAMPQAAD
jgi:molybdopterin converting factor small subunit